MRQSLMNLFAILYDADELPIRSEDQTTHMLMEVLLAISRFPDRDYLIWIDLNQLVVRASEPYQMKRE
jgi:hypothetical protein